MKLTGKGQKFTTRNKNKDFDIELDNFNSIQYTVII